VLVWQRGAVNGRRDTSFDAVRTKGSWGEAGRRRRSVGGVAAPGLEGSGPQMEGCFCLFDNRFCFLLYLFYLIFFIFHTIVPVDLLTSSSYEF